MLCTIVKYDKREFSPWADDIQVVFVEIYVSYDTVPCPAIAQHHQLLLFVLFLTLWGRSADMSAPVPSFSWSPHPPKLSVRAEEGSCFCLPLTKCLHSTQGYPAADDSRVNWRRNSCNKNALSHYSHDDAPPLGLIFYCCCVEMMVVFNSGLCLFGVCT